MSADKYCSTHGAYPPKYASCPGCESEAGRPSAPASLDDQMTRVPKGQGVPSRQSDPNDDLTQMPRRPVTSRSGPVDLDETQIDRPQTGLLGWAIVKTGMRRGTIHRIGHDVTIGRQNADIVLPDSKASRLHAKFAIQNGQFVIADMLSENGTCVNGEKIMQVTPLKENDEIRIGDTALVIKTLEP